MITNCGNVRMRLIKISLVAKYIEAANIAIKIILGTKLPIKDNRQLAFIRTKYMIPHSIAIIY